MDLHIYVFHKINATCKCEDATEEYRCQSGHVLRACRSIARLGACIPAVASARIFEISSTGLDHAIEQESGVGIMMVVAGSRREERGGQTIGETHLKRPIDCSFGTLARLEPEPTQMVGGSQSSELQPDPLSTGSESLALLDIAAPDVISVHGSMPLSQVCGR